MLQVINFTLQEYTDKDIEFINNIELYQLDKIFSVETNNSLLTSALYRLVSINNNFYAPIDLTLLSNNVFDNTQVFVVHDNGKYLTHAYLWSVKNPTNKYEIVLNLFLETTDTTIFDLLLSNIEEWYYMNIDIDVHKYYLRIIQPPIELISHIINSNFNMLTNINISDNITWMLNSSSINNSPLLEYHIFRELDYVKIL